MVARRVARTGLLGVAGIALLTSVSCSSTGGESASSTSSPSTTSGGGAGSTTSTAAPTTTGKAAANETTTTAGAATDEFKTSALRAYLAQMFPHVPEWKYNPDEIWPNEQGFCARWFLDMGGARMRGFDFVILKDGLIQHNEVYTVAV